MSRQLLILMTNLMLLFPREHHCTQPKYSKLGFLYREPGERMTDLLAGPYPETFKPCSGVADSPA